MKSEVQKMTQVASFRDRMNAERLVSEMKHNGVHAGIREYHSGNDGTFYRVFARMRQGTQKQGHTASVPSFPAVKKTAQVSPVRTDISRDTRQQPTLSRGAIRITGSPDTQPVSMTSPEKVGPPGVVMAASKAGMNELQEEELAHFDSREEAEKFVKKMKINGFDTVIRDDLTDEKKTFYRVFLLLPAGQAAERSSASYPGDIRQADRGGYSENIVERKMGYFHVSLALLGVYTDNAFNTRENKKSDFSLMLEPEVWIAFPPVKQNPHAGSEGISVRSPGGRAMSGERKETFRRYQTVLSYMTSIPLSSRNSPSGDSTGHNFRGTFNYNFRGGLSLDFEDLYARSFEVNSSPDPAVPYEPDIYNSNRFYARAIYETSRKTMVRFDYSHFSLDFDAPRNQFRNRTDNAFSGYAFYKLQPKTSIFIEYGHIDISYDSDKTLDSREQHFFGGIDWDMTAKSKGSIKAGYGIKDFSKLSETSKNFIGEARIDHKLTAKTTLIFSAFRRTDETNMLPRTFILSQGVGVKYNQILTAKVSGVVSLLYSRDKYMGGIITGSVSRGREDDVYQATVGLQHEFRRYLKSSIGYTFIKRDSSIPIYTFSGNTLSFRITGSF